MECGLSWLRAKSEIGELGVAPEFNSVVFAGDDCGTRFVRVAHSSFEFIGRCGAFAAGKMVNRQRRTLLPTQSVSLEQFDVMSQDLGFCLLRTEAVAVLFEDCVYALGSAAGF